MKMMVRGLIIFCVLDFGLVSRATENWCFEPGLAGVYFGESDFANPENEIDILDRLDNDRENGRGDDPVKYQKHIADRVIHVHVKDIPKLQLSQRGKVTGTRVGVAAGDGEVDLPGVIEVLNNVGYNAVLSAECDAFDQAKRSLDYLKGLVE
jgi:sugar phosphate isomerase/epimerase